LRIATRLLPERVISAGNPTALAAVFRYLGKEQSFQAAALGVAVAESFLASRVLARSKILFGKRACSFAG
jgi:hypothetical protein